VINIKGIYYPVGSFIKALYKYDYSIFRWYV